MRLNGFYDALLTERLSFEVKPEKRLKSVFESQVIIKKMAHPSLGTPSWVPEALGQHRRFKAQGESHDDDTSL